MSPRSHSNTQNCKCFNPCLLLLKDDTGIVSRNEMSPFRAHCYCPAKLELPLSSHQRGRNKGLELAFVTITLVVTKL